jgi:Protein of unknown function (DUF1997)
MESPLFNNQNSAPETPLNSIDDNVTEHKPMDFYTAFGGCMEMYGNESMVGDYFNNHQGWFCRCSKPMQVDPMGENGYIITVGHFGSLGYEVEPKMAVILHPPENGFYLTESVPIPDYTPPGYTVDYKAEMLLKEVPVSEAAKGIEEIFKKNKQSLPDVITKVNWSLKLGVSVQLPNFMYKLPLNLLQTGGDRFLAQIIRQISPRLTYKVQSDFHSTNDLPIPPKGGRTFFKIEEEQNNE